VDLWNKGKIICSAVCLVLMQFFICRNILEKNLTFFPKNRSKSRHWTVIEIAVLLSGRKLILAGIEKRAGLKMDENCVIAIKDMIYEIRGHKVMLDNDLANLYEIETKFLNRAVKRNMERFPDFFMFQLTEDEWRLLRCQFGTLKKYIRKYRPYVFTNRCEIT